MKNVILIATIALALLFVFKKTTAQQTPEISIEKFIELYKKHKTPQLIDVRTPQEYKYDGHVKGTRLVPLSELSSKGETALPKLNKQQPVYVICRSGNRSLVAARLLQTLGFSQVYSIKGGTSAWIIAGQPVEK